MTLIVLVTELVLKHPKGSVVKILFLTLNLTTYNPPVVGKVCVVLGTVVTVEVPSPQSHSYLTKLPEVVVEFEALNVTVEEPGANDVEGQISTVEVSSIAAIGGTHGETQEIVLVQPAYWKLPSDVKRKDKHPSALFDVIVNGTVGKPVNASSPVPAAPGVFPCHTSKIS